ncbi:hypothetical protein BGZ49_010694 [Haplosporangium sp. Z 27]|nr:hypothetical protein BGZ49_010694 [Haplosporangium sp. Z 27]
MPYRSERQQILSEINEALIYAWMEEDEELINELLEISEHVSSSRFIQRNPIYRRISYFLTEVFPDMPDGEFRAMFRTTREGFKGVLELVKDNPIFHNASRHQQAHPSVQLAVALARFGSNGTGATVSKLQTTFQIGAGTVTLYTKRVIKALLDVHDDWITWPSARRRSEIGQVMREEGFPGCVGYIDGTTVTISQKPALDGEAYYDRKKR